MISHAKHTFNFAQKEKAPGSFYRERPDRDMIKQERGYFYRPAGSWPRGQNPRRYPWIPRVYTLRNFKTKNVSTVSKFAVCGKISI